MLTVSISYTIVNSVLILNQQINVIPAFIGTIWMVLFLLHHIILLLSQRIQRYLQLQQKNAPNVIRKTLHIFKAQRALLMEGLGLPTFVALKIATTPGQHNVSYSYYNPLCRHILLFFTSLWSRIINLIETFAFSGLWSVYNKQFNNIVHYYIIMNCVWNVAQYIMDRW